MDEFAIWEHKTLTAENARDLYFSGEGGLLSNDSDADGQALTAIKLTDPTAGTLTFDPTGAFTYDSTGASEGNYTFDYKVNDNGGSGNDSNVATVTIRVNGPPSGADDPGYSVAYGSVLPVNAPGVLANDTGNGDVLSAFLASTPADGVLSLNADGSFDYNATGTSGVKTFTYKVSDGSFEAGPYTVTITVQSANIPSYSNLHGDGVTFTGGGSAVALDSGSDSTVTDADTSVFNGGTLTLSVASGGVSGQDVLAILNVGTGSGQIGVAGSTVSYEGSAIGTFAGGSSGADLVITFNTSAATLAAVQALGRAITYSAGGSPTVQNRTVTYSLNDGSNAGTATVTVTVAGTPVNNAPVITSDGGGPTASVSVAENQTAVTTVVATDADAGATLTYTTSGGADQSKFDLNSTTGVLIFKAAPDYEANGSAAGNNAYVVEVNVSDGTDSDSQTITVTVTDVDDPPVVANALSDVTVAEDAADSSIDLSNVFNDVDDANSSITKTAVSSDTGLVTVAVSGDTLTLDYQADQNGTATITVTGDSGGLPVDDVFTVTVTGVDDHPVVANALSDVTVAEEAADSSIDLSNVFNDVDDANSSITKTAVSSDTGLVTVAVSGDTLTLDYQADQNGTATITVTADSGGLTVDDVFTVTVTGCGRPPGGGERLVRRYCDRRTRRTARSTCRTYSTTWTTRTRRSRRLCGVEHERRPGDGCDESGTRADPGLPGGPERHGHDHGDGGFRWSACGRRVHGDCDRPVDDPPVGCERLVRRHCGGGCRRTARSTCRTYSTTWTTRTRRSPRPRCRTRHRPGYGCGRAVTR